MCLHMLELVLELALAFLHRSCISLMGLLRQNFMVNIRLNLFEYHLFHSTQLINQ